MSDKCPKCGAEMVGRCHRQESDMNTTHLVDGVVGELLCLRRQLVRLKRAILRAWSRSDRYGPVADGSPYAAGYYTARACFLKAAEAAKEKK